MLEVRTVQSDAGTFERPIRKEEAALFLGRSLRSLERDMNARKVPYYKMGKTVSFRLSDLVAYRTRCLIQPKGVKP